MCSDEFYKEPIGIVGHKRNDEYSLATPEQCVELGIEMGKLGYKFDFKKMSLLKSE